MNLNTHFAPLAGIRPVMSGLVIAGILIVRPIAGAPLSIPADSPAPRREAPPPFAPAPFHLERSSSLPTQPLDLEKSYGVRIDFPLGLVRIDYGLLLREDHVFPNGRFNFNGDFPGPGYRQQRAAPLKQAFPAAGANAQDLLL